MMLHPMIRATGGGYRGGPRAGGRVPPPPVTAAAWPSAGPVPSPVQDPKSSNVISKDQQIVHKSRTMLGALGLVALVAALFVASAAAKTESSATILLVPLPWRSSLTPMRALARELHARALPVTMAVCEDVVAPFEGDGYKLLRLPACLSASAADASASGAAAAAAAAASEAPTLDWSALIDASFTSSLPPANWSAIRTASLRTFTASNTSPLDADITTTAASMSTPASELERLRSLMYPALLRFCTKHAPAAHTSATASTSPFSTPPTPPATLLLVADRWALAGGAAAAATGIEWIQLQTRAPRDVGGGSLWSPVRSSPAAARTIDTDELEFRHLSERAASPLAGTFDEDDFDFEIGDNSDDADGSDDVRGNAQAIVRLVHAYFPAFRHFVLDSAAAHLARLVAAATLSSSSSSSSTSLSDLAAALAAAETPASTAALNKLLDVVVRQHSCLSAAASSAAAATKAPASTADFDLDANAASASDALAAAAIDDIWSALRISACDAQRTHQPRSWLDTITGSGNSKSTPWHSLTGSNAAATTNAEFRVYLRVHVQRALLDQQHHNRPLEAKSAAHASEACSLPRSSDDHVAEYVRRQRRATAPSTPTTAGAASSSTAKPAERAASSATATTSGASALDIDGELGGAGGGKVVYLPSTGKKRRTSDGVDDASASTGASDDADDASDGADSSAIAAAAAAARAQAALSALPWPLSALAHVGVAQWAASWFVDGDDVYSPANSGDTSGNSAGSNGGERVWSALQCASFASASDGHALLACLRSLSAAWPHLPPHTATTTTHLSASMTGLASSAALVTALDAAGAACAAARTSANTAWAASTSPEAEHLSSLSSSSSTSAVTIDTACADALNKLRARTRATTGNAAAASARLARAVAAAASRTAFVAGARAHLFADAVSLSSSFSSLLSRWSSVRRLGHLWAHAAALTRRLKRRLTAATAATASAPATLHAGYDGAFSFRDPALVLCTAVSGLTERVRSLPSSTHMVGPLLPPSLLMVANQSARCPQAPFSLRTGGAELNALDAPPPKLAKGAAAAAAAAKGATTKVTASPSPPASQSTVGRRLAAWLAACERAHIAVVYVQLDGALERSDHIDAQDVVAEADVDADSNGNGERGGHGVGVWTPGAFRALLNGLLHPSHAVLLVGSSAQRAALFPHRLPPSVRWLRSSLPPSALLLRQPAVRLLVATGASPALVHEAMACAKPQLLLPSTVAQRRVAAAARAAGVALVQPLRVFRAGADTAGRVDSVLVAWAVHLLLHADAVRTHTARAALQARATGGNRAAADAVEAAFGMVRALFGARTLGGAASEVEDESGVALAASLLAPLPTPYKYNGYSLPAAATPDATLSGDGDAAAAAAAAAGGTSAERAAAALAAEFVTDTVTRAANLPRSRAAQLAGASGGVAPARFALAPHERHAYAVSGSDVGVGDLDASADATAFAGASAADTAHMSAAERRAFTERQIAAAAAKAALDAAKAATAAAAGDEVAADQPPRVQALVWSWYTRVRADQYAVFAAALTTALAAWQLVRALMACLVAEFQLGQK